MTVTQDAVQTSAAGPRPVAGQAGKPIASKRTVLAAA
jgi:hypothetical protein